MDISRTWAQYKELLDSKEPLHQYVDFGTSYTLWFDEGSAHYECIVDKTDPPSENQIDFENNYSENANQSSSFRTLNSKTLDGLTKVSSVPAIDPEYVCFCQGVSKRITTADNVVEWAVSFPSVQLMGMTVQATGFDRHDKLLFEVGYYAGEDWVQISGYGFDIPLVVDPIFFHKESCRISSPIPQGLIFRVVHTFVNPSTERTPDLGIIYHLQRPYA